MKSTLTLLCLCAAIIVKAQFPDNDPNRRTVLRYSLGTIMSLVNTNSFYVAPGPANFREDPRWSPYFGVTYDAGKKWSVEYEIHNNNFQSTIIFPGTPGEAHSSGRQSFHAKYLLQTLTAGLKTPDFRLCKVNLLIKLNAGYGFAQARGVGIRTKNFSTSPDEQTDFSDYTYKSFSGLYGAIHIQNRPAAKSGNKHLRQLVLDIGFGYLFARSPEFAYSVKLSNSTDVYSFSSRNYLGNLTICASLPLVTRKIKK